MAINIMTYMISACGLSDIGLVRQNNEDVWSAIPELRFYVIADGMGGHLAGEVASDQAVKSLCAIINNNKTAIQETSNFHDMRKLVCHAIQEVNALIYKMSRLDPNLRGMGTTLCALLFFEKGLVYAHVGDSRIYRFRKNRLEQMTKDHSLLTELIAQGEYLKSEEAGLPHKNIITKAIGTERFVEPSTHFCDVETGDFYLMCSDGLSDMLSIKEIEIIFHHDKSVDAIAQELVSAAKVKGGYDNITVVVTKIESSSGVTKQL